MSKIETLTQWGLKFPNGDIEWDDIHRPRWERDEYRRDTTRQYAGMAREMRQGIEALPIWVQRTVTIHFSPEIKEIDTRDDDVGFMWRRHDEGLAMAS